MLAKRLSWTWVDADALLEERQGRSIRAIFAEDGETAFREMEAAVLRDLCKLTQHVISTGGGVVLREENRQRLRDGDVVWLTADLATICGRIENDSTTRERRPNLTVGGREEIETLLRERQPLYAACADLVFDTTDRSAEDIAADVLKRLGEAQVCRSTQSER